MKKYRCTICGYIYDEEKEGVKFADLPEDWKCPLCGAPKSLFVEITKEEEKKEVIEESIADENESDELRELSNGEIAYICSNLAKACEKEYLEEEKELYQKLHEYFNNKTLKENGTIDDIVFLYQQDVDLLNKAMNTADKYNDRGAKRVITWASKSTNIINSIIKTYKEKGIDYINNTKIWVCDICGFVFIGDNPPQVCPICKVPSFKILEVK